MIVACNNLLPKEIYEIISCGLTLFINNELLCLMNNEI